jgi:hypothetical protein
MRIAGIVAGALLIVLMLLDGFETILLPRRVNRPLRFARTYYRTLWWLWRHLARMLPAGRWREGMLGIFGPLSMLGLFASWAIGLVLGFAILQWSIGASLRGDGGSEVAGTARLATCVYFSGTTLFTLGLGDISPVGRWPRALSVIEAGLGFGFLAVIISYLPVLYQAFSRREAVISLMDTRAGSPPGGAESIVRLAEAGRLDNTDGMLREWEQWCAELLESHISFPVLAYYRSQHANQSWLAALATILDACALLLSVVEPARRQGQSYQAELTFAMARHAAVDVCLILSVPPHDAAEQRLDRDVLARLDESLRKAGGGADTSAEAQGQFGALRAMYEPFLGGLSRHLMLTLPPLLAPAGHADNWQRSAWQPRTPGIGNLPGGARSSDHFD